VVLRLVKAAVGLVETRKQRSVARSVEYIIMTTCGDDEDDIIIVIVFDRCYSMLLLPPAPSVTLSCCHHEHASPRGVPTADIPCHKHAASGIDCATRARRDH